METEGPGESFVFLQKQRRGPPAALSGRERSTHGGPVGEAAPCAAGQVKGQPDTFLLRGPGAFFQTFIYLFILVLLI